MKSLYLVSAFLLMLIAFVLAHRRYPYYILWSVWDEVDMVCRAHLRLLKSLLLFHKWLDGDDDDDDNDGDNGSGYGGGDDNSGGSSNSICCGIGDNKYLFNFHLSLNSLWNCTHFHCVLNSVFASV